jgi:hypothetical protein
MESSQGLPSKTPSEAEIAEARQHNTEFDQIFKEDVVVENRKLNEIMALIDDVISHHGIHGSMRVGSILEDILDKEESDKLINEVPPESKFHKNYPMLRHFVELLRGFKGEKLFVDGDNMNRVYDSLFTRFDTNREILQSYQ